MLILLVGDYKKGKTVSACTFPKPLLFLDFDDGFTSVKTTKGKDGKMVVEDVDKIDVVSFYKARHVNLEFKTAEKADFARSIAPAHVAQSAEIITQYNKVIEDLFSGEPKYKTLVIDSLTTMFRIWKEAILSYNKIPQLRIADYGTLEGILFGQFIPTLKSLHKTKVENIILIDHEMMDKDELSGKILEFPIGPSRQMGKELGKEFDEIWRQTIDGGEYVWRTKPSGFFTAGSRMNIPDPVKPGVYNTIKSIVEGGAK